MKHSLLLSLLRRQYTVPQRHAQEHRENQIARGWHSVRKRPSSEEVEMIRACWVFNELKVKVTEDGSKAWGFVFIISLACSTNLQLAAESDVEGSFHGPDNYDHKMLTGMA
ncbi:hypothetical protein LENED_008777 [Lentinula edodes]|uniref:Uncharacterized protein n=1 Tax=Lentinula edodes TaxID=5353 RepID=A0A1Q3EHX7_LENED|nr:hypothetical protein LENED_008777 [Lentinula edodes]